MRTFLSALAIVAALAPPLLAEPDWKALTDETAQILSAYAKIDTTNPPGNELPAAEFLQATLAKDGIESKLYPSAPGRANLVARIKGTGKAQPILLLHHMDVVPAQASDWSFPPFSGAIEDGFVYGRGTLDDKGGGVVQLGALLARVREHKRCARDLIFLAVADEEVGGAEGAIFMVKNHLDDIRAEAVWNEGGATIEGLLPKRPVNSIAVTEKNSLWITLKASGEGGHGSSPTANGGINILIAALSRIAAWERPLHLAPAMREALRRLGGAVVPGGAFAASHIDAPPLSWIVNGRIKGNRVLNSSVRDTISLTGLRAGLKHNVIPAHAEADLDARLLPDTNPKEFIAELKQLIADPRIAIEVVHDIPELQPPSHADTAFFRALEQAIEKRLPSSVSIPGMLTGGSDCKAFRAVGIDCYGYQPLLATQDMISRFHGIDERVSLDNLRFGVQVSYDTLETLCAE